VENRSEVLRLVLLVALCLFLFFFGLGTRALWDVDEGMHAATSKDMVISGDWVTPTFNGEPFFDKPILFTWLVSISFLLWGFSELGARFPAAVIGLACVLVTYLLGRRMFSSRVGFLAGLILATATEYLIVARTVVHDSALLLFTTLSLFLFYSGVVEEKRRGRYFLLLHVALGLAVLAKGPLGLLLPGLVIGPYLLLTKRLALIREMRLGWGVLIVLVIAAPWYILMGLRHAGYLSYFLIEKNFGSYASAGSQHPAPLHFYVPVLLGGLLPWSGLLPATLYRANSWVRGERRDAVLFLLLWAGVMFLFFSVAVSKLAPYILPLFPAAALLVALLWEDLLGPATSKVRKMFIWSLVPAFVLMVAVAIYVGFQPPLSLEVKYGMSMVQVHTLSLSSVLALALALGALVVRRYRFAMATIVGLVAAVLVVFVVNIAPAMDPFRSTKDLALKLDRLLAPGEEIAFFKRLKDSALFYTDRYGRVVRTAEDLEGHFSTGGRAYCVVDKRHRDRLQGLEEEFPIALEQANKMVLTNSKTAKAAKTGG